jgi:hypothetical protein
MYKIREDELFLTGVGGIAIGVATVAGAPNF